MKPYQEPTLPDTDEVENEWTPAITTLRARRARPAASPVTKPAAHASLPAPAAPAPARRRVRMDKPAWLMVLGVLIVLALAILFQRVLLPALGWTQDQWHYGDSRITQIDATVGHGGTSHFLALYTHGDIVILEIPLDHPDLYHVYTLTGFISASGTPVILLTVQDINHDGKPDLLVQVEGSSFEEVLFNTGSSFSANEGK